MLASLKLAGRANVTTRNARGPAPSVTAPSYFLSHRTRDGVPCPPLSKCSSGILVQAQATASPSILIDAPIWGAEKLRASLGHGARIIRFAFHELRATRISCVSAVSSHDRSAILSSVPVHWAPPQMHPVPRAVFTGHSRGN